MKGSIGASTRGEPLYPKFRSSYWLPRVGERVQCKDPIFPVTYGKLAVVTKRLGLGRVRVRLEEDGRLFGVAVRALHEIERWGLMASLIDRTMDIG